MRYFFIVIIIFTTCSVFGQENKFRLGFSLAPSFTNVRGPQYFDKVDNLYRNKTQRGSLKITFGANLEYEIRDKFSLTLGLNYARKGGLLANPIYYSDYQTGEVIESLYGENITDYVRKYITMPFFGSFKFGPKKTFFLNGGVFGGFLLSSTKDAFYWSKTNSYRFDAGLLIGLGGMLDLSDKFALSFEFRNNLGLVNIDNTPELGSMTLKTNSFNIITGLSWKLGEMDSK